MVNISWLFWHKNDLNEREGVCTCTHTLTQRHPHAHIHTHLHTDTHKNTNTQTYTNLHTDTHTNTSHHMHVMCIYTHIHIHKQTCKIMCRYMLSLSIYTNINPHFHRKIFNIHKHSHRLSQAAQGQGHMYEIVILHADATTHDYGSEQPWETSSMTIRGAFSSANTAEPLSPVRPRMLGNHRKSAAH